MDKTRFAPVTKAFVMRLSVRERIADLRPAGVLLVAILRERAVVVAEAFHANDGKGSVPSYLERRRGCSDKYCRIKRPQTNPILA